MKFLFVVMMISAPGFCAGQGLLAFRNDLAFEASTINRFAGQAYRFRLRELAARGQLDQNAVLLGRLRNVVEKLKPAAQLELPEAASIAWEIHLCQRCDENASSMAGGKLLVGEEFVTELGLSEDELAFVLAHEMAHVLAEHTREFATVARDFLANGRNREYEDIQGELDESLVVNMKMAADFARQEFEADYMGFVLGARSGFDPDSMPAMLRKIHRGAASGFSLHPGEEERLQRANDMLEFAHRIRAMGIPRS